MDPEQLQMNNLERKFDTQTSEDGPGNIRPDKALLDGQDDPADGGDGELDHNPHQLFIELDELVIYEDENTTEVWEWKERARWIKFEEDTLNYSSRWSPPHVSSISFHSFEDLRKALEQGVVSLDMRMTGSLNMTQQIIKQLADEMQLSCNEQRSLIEALLFHHDSASHQKSASSNNLDRAADLLLMLTDENSKESGDTDPRAPDVYQEQLKGKRFIHNDSGKLYNKELLKKIPDDAEVMSVLVGAINEIEKPVTALVRLSKGEHIDKMAEVPLPVRFIFICVGPPGIGLNYVEIGRSISTLMSNKDFSRVVYTATDRQKILSAMDKFLNFTMILTPFDSKQKSLALMMHTTDQKECLKTVGGIQESSDESCIRTDRIKDTNDDLNENQIGDPLIRTGTPFGGVINDVRRRYPKYWSDIRDGFSLQVLATTIFIYFAAVSITVTFGGLLDEKTDGLMGATENLLSTAICGVLHGLFSGQPLVHTGLTASQLVFDEGVFTFARNNDIDYMSWRLWIGVWICVFIVIFVASEASFLIKYVTGFTQEVYASLVALIFIFETFSKLLKIFEKHPPCWNYEGCLKGVSQKLSYLQEKNISQLVGHNSVDIGSYPTLNSSSQMGPSSDVVHPYNALLSMTLTLSTFALAYYLKGLRNKKLFGRTIRRTLSDFGVTLSIALMCLTDILIGDDDFTQKLSIPEKFGVTSPEKRGWLISPLGLQKPLPVGHIFSAAVPALFGSILIVLEALIAGMLVNKREYKLRKGTGFHLDVLLMGVYAIICGVLGIPFVTAVTVRAVAHTSALTVVSRNNAPGERPKIEGTIEQRVSNFVVHALVGASVFLGIVLRYLPMPVLFGVFLYMGVALFGGTQIYDRITMIFTPAKHHPTDLPFVRYVKMKKMHLFTLVQLIFVPVLWTVMLSPAAIAFPFFLILVIPFRLFILKFMFSEQELSQIDPMVSTPTPTISKSVGGSEPDFYEQAHMP